MSDRITVRMIADMIARIDLWIAAQPGYVSRQETVRRFVAFSLRWLDCLPAAKAGGSESPMVGHGCDHPDQLDDPREGS